MTRRFKTHGGGKSLNQKNKTPDVWDGRQFEDLEEKAEVISESTTKVFVEHKYFFAHDYQVEFKPSLPGFWKTVLLILVEN